MATNNSSSPINDMPELDSPDEDGSVHAKTTATSSTTTAPGKKKGKSKGDKEVTGKAQNRIAQREFRQVRLLICLPRVIRALQRKQQHVEEVEAKVTVLELGQHEQVERMGNALKELLEEDQKLRTLLAHLGGVIGDGLGGALPHIGMDVPGFEAIISRTSIDTAQEALHLKVLSSGQGSAAASQTGLVAPLSAHSVDPPGSAHDSRSRPRRTTDSASPEVLYHVPPPLDSNELLLPAVPQPIQRYDCPQWSHPPPYPVALPDLADFSTYAAPHPGLPTPLPATAGIFTTLLGVFPREYPGLDGIAA